MTVTRELIKSEIDKVRDEHLSVLFRIVQALEEPSPRAELAARTSGWKHFVAEAYGSLASDPIARGDQGEFDARVPFE